MSQQQQLTEGLIVDGSRGIYHVQTAQGLLQCTIRGRLRKSIAYPESTSGRKGAKSVKVKEKDPVAVGDRVQVLPIGQATGVIEEVLARAGGSFTRGDPMKGSLTSIAGIDQMVVVLAAREPSPHLRMLDRFMVIAEAQEMDLTLCINKIDLGIEPWLAERLQLYADIGYPVVRVCATTGEGIDELRARLGGRVSALIGPSGVGKSSLLNAIEPQLSQRVSQVSESTHKGRHTTTGTQLFALAGPAGGHLADTAGIRMLAIGTLPVALDRCFREFRPWLGNCLFGDCRHVQEPDCAVRQAVNQGMVDRERYASYLRLLDPLLTANDDDWSQVE